MKSVLFLFLMVSLSFGAAIGQVLDTSRDLPLKNSPTISYEPPAVPNQGGDTVEDAIVIPGLPYSSQGTTEGYLDDYDEICPFDTPGSPDVVYSFTPDSDIMIDVDLCGSSYDTKTYIYDSAFNVVACNDDFYGLDDPCGTYVSKIQRASLLGGATYFIVVDGYDGENGEYLINISIFEPCFVYCPADAIAEGEPPIVDGYIDEYNSGCASPDPANHFLDIDWTNIEPGNPLDGRAWLCGKSGWYYGDFEMARRETDWFRVYAQQTGVMEVTVESEFPLYLFKLAPTDCASVGVELQATADCEDIATLTFPVTSGEEIWLWTGPTTFEGPVTEFTYFMTVANNTYYQVSTRKMNWGGVKSMYR